MKITSFRILCKSAGLSSIILGISLVFLFLRCTNNPASPDGQDVTITGQVVNKSGPVREAVSGANISAYQVNSDGTKEKVDLESVVTDENGEFRMTVPHRMISRLLIQAHKGNRSWKRYFEGKDISSDEISVGEIDLESTMEADIFVLVLVSTEDGDISYDAISEQITEQFAEWLEENQDQIQQMVRYWVEHRRSGLKIKAKTSDSGSQVDLKHRFRVATSDSAALVDSLVSRIALDSATVASNLWMRRYWKMHERESEFRIIADTANGRSTVKVDLEFMTEANEREQLILAIADSTQFTSNEIADALIFRSDDDDEHDGEKLKVEIDGDIELPDSTSDTLDSLKAAIQESSWEVELKLKVKWEEGEVSSYSDIEGMISDKAMGDWEKLKEDVIALISDIEDEEVELEIEIEWEPEHHDWADHDDWDDDDD